jgi:hypothetical protein
VICRSLSRGLRKAPGVTARAFAWQALSSCRIAFHKNFHDRGGRRTKVPEPVRSASLHEIRLPWGRLHRLRRTDGQFDFPRDRDKQVKANIVVLMHAADGPRLEFNASDANFRPIYLPHRRDTGIWTRPLSAGARCA